jgi:CubicO group peptidase (beta-lactamase class C family)
VDSVVTYAAQQDSKALLILHQGRMVVEEYFGTFTSDSLWYWASAGKSLTAGLVGQAVAAGEIDLNLPSRAYLGPGWSSLSSAQETLIRVEDHLRMTTGLNDGVFNPDCTLPTCLQYLAPAGSRWAYHNAPYTLLDAVLIGATGQNLNA